jgi:predicted DNA-binding transcriptional regulator AlpA
MNVQDSKTWPDSRPQAKSKAGKNWSELKPRDIEALKNFDSLPDSAGVHVGVVGALFGASNATVWRGGPRFPNPIKTGPKTTVWLVGELRQKLAELRARLRGAA